VAERRRTARATEEAAAESARRAGLEAELALTNAAIDRRRAPELPPPLAVPDGGSAAAAESPVVAGAGHDAGRRLRTPNPLNQSAELTSWLRASGGRRARHAHRTD
jgi:hypothetical protein